MNPPDDLLDTPDHVWPYIARLLGTMSAVLQILREMAEEPRDTHDADRIADMLSGIEIAISGRIRKQSGATKSARMAEIMGAIRDQLFVIAERHKSEARDAYQLTAMARDIDCALKQDLSPDDTPGVA